MKNLKKITSINLLALFTFSYSELAIDEIVKNDRSFLLQTEQKEQVQELIGKDLSDLVSDEAYNSSILDRMVQKRLPHAYKGLSNHIAEILIEEARKNGLDPFFLFAVIMTESSFNPEAKGRHGEIGLMQILPDTAEWIAGKLGFKEKIDLKNPRHNIMLGAHYLAGLRAKFDRIGNRYIAAYNMGPRNVSRLLASQKEPRIYSDKVLKHYNQVYQQAHKKASAVTQIAAL